MPDLQAIVQGLDTYIRPQTFPVAVKMLRKGEELPPKVRHPKKDLGIQIATCQGVSFARKYGWSLALTREDVNCAPGRVVMGFGKPIEYYTEGTICEGIYTGTKEAGAVTESKIPRLKYEEYETIVLAPLNRANFEPDILIIYGNAAQVMRLVQGALYKNGGRILSASSGRLDCADFIVEALQSGEPSYVLPCSGDRIFALTQDDEMCFTTPMDKVEDIVEGLKGTHNGGIRYPIPSYLQFQPSYPKSYEKLRTLLEEADAEGY